METRFLQCGQKLISLERPIVMGIVNTSPDSFYNKSVSHSENDFLTKVEVMMQDGATIIDLGGSSSRPKAHILSEEEEWNNVEKYIKVFVKQFPDKILSLDTYRSSIARKGLDLGVKMINDIHAGTYDLKMLELLEEYQVAYCMMHMRGEIGSMMKAEFLQYDDVVSDVIKYFVLRLQELQKSIKLNIVIDPGFGFSKTMTQNYDLLRHLSSFQILDKPILVGLSRKSMIYRLLDSDPEHALHGSIAATTVALIGGANIIRTHDVKATSDVIKIFEMWKSRN